MISYNAPERHEHKSGGKGSINPEFFHGNAVKGLMATISKFNPDYPLVPNNQYFTVSPGVGDYGNCKFEKALCVTPHRPPGLQPMPTPRGSRPRPRDAG